MSGLFDDAGIDPTELVNSKLAKGIYDGIVGDVEAKQSKAEDHYIVFSYALPVWEYPIQDWFRILPPGKRISDCDDTDDSFNVYTTRKNVTVRQTEKQFYTNAYKQLKRRLMDLGVPEDKVNAVNPVDLKGRPVRLAIEESEKNDFPVIAKVSVPGASGTSLPSGPPTVATAAAPAAPVTAAAVPSVASVPAQPVLANPFGSV